MRKINCIVSLCMLLQTTFVPLLAQYTDHRNHKIDSLEQVLSTHPPTGKELIVVYSDLAWGYKEINTKKSMDYARKSIDVAIPFDAWATITDSYRVLGQQYYGMSQYDSAMVYYDKALEATGRMREFSKYTETNIDDELSLIYGDIGNLYNIQGKNYEAIAWYQKAMLLFEKYGWKQSQSYLHSNMGQIHLAMENFEEAESNFLKADSLAHLLNDSLFISRASYHLSCLYLATKEYDKALKHAQIINDYNFAHPEQGGEKAVGLTLLSEIYLKGYDDEQKAEQYARQALELLEIFDDVREKSIALRLLSTICQKRGEWRKAEQAALEALAADDSEVVNTMALYSILAKVYAHMGDASKSGEYFDKYDKLKSLWSTQHYQSAIRDMEVKYETEKKATQITTLEGEKRQMIWLGIAGGAVLLLALAALFFLWRWAAQKKRLAEQQIKQLEQEKQLVATQAVLDGEIQERIRLARDLHDGLGSILAAAKYNFADIRKNFDCHTLLDMERYDTSVGLLDESMREMRRIAHHLMPSSLGVSGLKRSISDFCNTIPHVKFNWYGEETRLDPNMEVIIYRIMHELVSNALKHSGAKHILVEVVRYDDHIALTVQDDGCGFDTSAAAQGMGLANIRARVAASGGNLLVDSKPGVGTEVNVELRIENGKLRMKG